MKMEMQNLINEINLNNYLTDNSIKLMNLLKEYNSYIDELEIISDTLRHEVILTETERLEYQDEYSNKEWDLRNCFNEILNELRSILSVKYSGQENIVI